MNKKQIVIITGASRGIGFAAAKLFLEKGNIVYNISRNNCELTGINSVICNITDGIKLKETIENIYNKEKRIDILINNAGGGISGSAEKTDLCDAKRLFDLNFFAAFEAIKYTVPYMRLQKSGKIINIGSVAGAMHVPFQAFYSASKAAIEALTNCLRTELSPFGIKVSTIMPGDTKTGFTDAREKSFEKDDADYGSRIYRSISMMEKDEKNGMSPEKVAKVIYKAAVCKNPKPAYVAGFSYNFFIFLNKVLPKQFVQFVLGKIYG
ncbi:MAG: SDR family oxidoreductase [Treponema sp.]|nr:SDR family oxidoreductase [Treponema sp.]MCL2251683.1 SDR family oxidoreductase [Treponema sp.]